jgi:hypothetical protein
LVSGISKGIILGDYGFRTLDIYLLHLSYELFTCNIIFKTMSINNMRFTFVIPVKTDGWLWSDTTPAQLMDLAILMVINLQRT